jgi:putative phage-type endonuclease
MITQELSRYGIGGSEIAAVCGLNPYRAPIEVWREKVGLSEGFAGNEYTKWGHALEPLVREEYRLRNGVDMWVPAQSLFHDSVHWARATPDGVVLARKNEPVPTKDNWLHLVQVKTVGPRGIRRWENDQIPTEYEMQVLWEMFVTDLQRCDLAVLMGGQQYEERRVERNNDVIESMLEIATDFWKLVETKTEPPVDETDAYRDHLVQKMKRYPSATTINADTHTAILAKMLREQRNTLRAVESEIQGIENEIMAVMANAGADTLVTPDGQITWRATKPREVTDWKAAHHEIGERLAGTPHGEMLFKVISKHTRPAKESRPFKVPRDWSNEP